MGETKTCRFVGNQIGEMMSELKKYICPTCAFEYDPALGDPDSGIAPGTAFEDIPDDWICPVCGVEKSDFEVMT